MNSSPDQDKFSGHISNKVHDYAEEPSAGLWDKLDARIPEHIPQRKKRVLWWMWMPAVAVFTGIALWWSVSPPKEKNVQAIAQEHELISSQQKTADNVEAPVASKKQQSTKSAEQAPDIPNELTTEQPEADVKETSSPNPTAQESDGKLNQKKSSVKKTLPPVVNVLVPAAILADAANQPKQLVAEQSKEQVIKEPEQLLAQLPASTQNVSENNNGIPASEKEVAAQEPLYMEHKGLPPVVASAELIQFTVPEIKKDNSIRWASPVSPISIAIVNQVNYSITSHKKASERNFSGSDNTELANNLSNARANYSGGISIGIRLAERLMLSGGVRMTTYSEKYSYDLVAASSDPANAATNNPDFLMRPNEFYRNPGDSIIPGSTYSFVNRYFLREVPVSLTYYMPVKGKWSSYVDAGFSMVHVSYANGAFVDEDKVGFVVFDNVEAYPRFQSFYTLNLSAGVSYKLNSKFSIEAAPSVKYGLGSMIRDKRWVQQTPSFIGLNLSMRRHF